jgi:hypothetical protein
MDLLNQNTFSPMPKPALNGGLYTGEPYLPNAPWANVPVVPCAAYMTHMNLRSANPPPNALFQMQPNVRPGNSTDPQMPGVTRFVGDSNFGPFNFMCVPCMNMKKIDNSDCPPKKIRIN